MGGCLCAWVFVWVCVIVSEFFYCFDDCFVVVVFDELFVNLGSFCVEVEGKK